jgi:hypothetical protein
VENNQEIPKTDEEIAKENGLVEEGSEEYHSQLEAAGRGALAGVPGVPQLAGALGALQDQSDSSFGERYNKNKDAWDNAQTETKQEHPYTYGIAEMGGSIASGLAFPGEGLVSLGGWVLAKNLSDHPDDSLGKNLHESLVQTAEGYVGGKIIGAAASKTGEALKEIGNSTAIEWLTKNIKSAKNELNAHINTFYNDAGGALSKADRDAKFIDVLRSTQVNGKPILNPSSTIPQIIDDASILKEAAGNKISNILNTVSDSVKVNVDSIKNRILADRLNPQSNVVKSLNDPVTQQVMSKADDLIEQTFFNKESSFHANGELKETKLVPKDLSIKDIHDLKIAWASQSSELASKASNTASTVNKLDSAEARSRVMALTKYIDDSVTKALPKESKGAWSSANKNWADANVIGNIANVNNNSGNSVGIFKTMKNWSTMAGTGAGFVAHTMGAPLPAAVGLGLVVKQALNSGEVLAPRLAKGMDNLSNFLIKAPMSDISMRVIAASQGTPNEYQDTVNGAISEINLSQQPIERNSVSVKNNSDDILQIAQAADPDLASKLRQSIKDNDDKTIGAIMDSLSKLPQAKKFIQGGVGWDGKVTNKDDAAHISSQIDAMPISLRQKLEHQKNLRSTGQIPKITPEQPYYLQYKERNKSNQDY